MNNLLTKEQLIAFEDDIAECFNNAMIKAPIHLYYGNEEQMIDIFKKVQPEDWVFCTWRSHYQCLLKGVPQEQIKKDILEGKSITLCYPEYNVYSSAIVTGNIPIATGMALPSSSNAASGQLVREVNLPPHIDYIKISRRLNQTDATNSGIN